ncbi:hypothetical protein M378DRAFT_161366 [Amanita muscaria Koide BX008]|uniref:Uncharacterized protein n=1 Tax=Amanita muscaria (strain Koide BX008) TaxID=946122 RepID=A0A0C2WWD6_AMAMK|nr:hypothetical protein M378DRAFT_161366 [Amanita muscaria Koide BX008]
MSIFNFPSLTSYLPELRINSTPHSPFSAYHCTDRSLSSILDANLPREYTTPVANLTGEELGRRPLSTVRDHQRAVSYASGFRHIVAGGVAVLLPHDHITC